MPKPSVQVQGLAELRKALKAAGDGAEQELKEELQNSSMMSAIVQDARQRLTATFGRVENTGVKRLVKGKTSATSRSSRSTGKAAAAIRVGATAKAVFVTVSKSKVPYYGWLDFGGELKATGRRHNTQKRPFVKRGRAIYPAIDAHRPQIRRVAVQAMENIEQKAGLHG